MKNSVHPGALVKANLDELNLRVHTAKSLKVTRQQLQKVMEGKNAVAPELALRFEKAFGGNADVWLRMQVAYDLARAQTARRNKYSAPGRAAVALTRPPIAQLRTRPKPNQKIRKPPSNTPAADSIGP